jgi:hypothetical protein
LSVAAYDATIDPQAVRDRTPGNRLPWGGPALPFWQKITAPWRRDYILFLFVTPFLGNI